MGENIPLYSILSHTWTDEEVTFNDFTAGSYQHLKGYQKILGCCKVSQQEGFGYTWIDTCCIDKSSSAELSEAINSMFRWYKNSATCYAYLSDVSESDTSLCTSPGPGILESQFSTSFSQSRWFTRGWTLQELIAPDIVIFLNGAWQEIGTRSSLIELLVDSTGIDQALFEHNRHLHDITQLLRGYPIAQRMSWAANRRTTRVEDVAYSLIGLFDVNMPLLYGEGSKAFTRLQREIMNDSDDFSIFAWEPEHMWSLSSSGLLAYSPACFPWMDDRIALVSTKLYGHSRLSSNPVLSYEISKSRAMLNICILGSPRTLSKQNPQLLSRLKTARIKGGNLWPCEFKGQTEENLLIGVLNCRTRKGLIVLLLRDGGQRIFERYHKGPSIYLDDEDLILPPAQCVYVELNKQIPQQGIVQRCPTQARVIIRLGGCGYSLKSASSEGSKDDENIWWLFGSVNQGFFHFHHAHHEAWPPFLLLYHYDIDSCHVRFKCFTVQNDFTEGEARMAVEKYLETLESSHNTEEIRMWLTDTKQVVVKVRITSHLCDLLCLME